MLKVIYEDNHLLVVEKPVNIPVQADDSGDPDLLTQAKKYIKEKYNKPGDVYLGLVHRLDRPVGGVMVFARTSKAASRLTDSLKTHRGKKKYAALLINEPTTEGNLINYIVRDEATHSSRIVGANTPGAQKASLELHTVTTKNGLTLADILLHTGRHHQIRVQMSGIGAPIYGDQRYNKTAKPGKQIALYAYSLTIEHPTLHENMTFTCDPEGKSWEGFEEELTALTNGVRCAYIDENIIAVNKTADIACTIADGGEDTIEARLNCAFGKVYPLHRLDVPTSGLVLFARNETAEKELASQIRDRSIVKTYEADVLGVPREAGTLVFYAKKDAEKALVTVFDAPAPGAREMITNYRVISVSGGPVPHSRVEIELVTGRTHQIRASFAHIGCPVIGDDKYGDRTANKSFPGGLRLCAKSIRFPEETGELIKLDRRSIEVRVPFGE